MAMVKKKSLEDWIATVRRTTSNEARFDWLNDNHVQAVHNRRCVAEFQKETWWIADPDGFTVHEGEVRAG